MQARFYNGLSRQYEDFVPLNDQRVTMYVCGPTVYDEAHIGNGRPAVVFDLVYRLLRELYGPDHVVYARNITDVDDKIIAKAAHDHVDIATLTRETTEIYQEDVAGLGCLDPSLSPRATEYIDDMVTLISKLIELGHAYVAEDHVLFDVHGFDGYGQLSNRSLEDMLAGARVEVASYKRHDLDFVLWKPAAAGEPGWESPWGRGRPGWHIECSAMIASCLGMIIDVHGGGIDLTFPHHENEIAQSCCATGNKLLARFWMHNGFVMVNGQKMSKSLGNFLTMRGLRKDHAGRALRLQMLMSHYRQPLDWQTARTSEAHAIVKNWGKFVSDVPREKDDDLLGALCDDLNTPLAITIMHRRAREQDHGKLAFGWDLLGFADADEQPLIVHQRLGEVEIESMLKARQDARKSRDFAKADQIRDDLLSKGILIKDGPKGTDWEYAD